MCTCVLSWNPTLALRQERLHNVLHHVKVPWFFTTKLLNFSRSLGFPALSRHCQLAMPSTRSTNLVSELNIWSLLQNGFGPRLTALCTQASPSHMFSQRTFPYTSSLRHLVIHNLRLLICHNMIASENKVSSNSICKLMSNSSFWNHVEFVCNPSPFICPQAMDRPLYNTTL